MAKRRYSFDEEKISRFLKEGRGQGHGAQYSPWLTVQDVSSLGRATRIHGRKTEREHHLLSDIETSVFLLLDWSDAVIDIREQYPLDREETRRIAAEMGVRHPFDTLGKCDIVMTTDFLVDVQTSNGPQLHVRQHVDLLDIYVRGTAVDHLLRQVTCGDVGLKNTVVLPSSMYSLMVDRLDEYMHEAGMRKVYWEAKTNLHNFLVHRCAKPFLQEYMARHPELPSQVDSPGLYLDAVSETMVAVRLHKTGLLPAESRLRFVEKLSEYAVQGEDLSVLDDADLRSVFTEGEYLWVIQQVEQQLVPRLSYVRRRFTSGYHYDNEDPNELIAPYERTLDILEQCFPDDSKVLAAVRKERLRLLEWVSEQEGESHDSFSPGKLGTLDDADVQQNARSIFDDVDE